MKNLALSVLLLSSAVALGSRCVKVEQKRLCVGQKVISEKGDAGIIRSINADKTVQVFFTKHNQTHPWPIHRLGLRKGCASNGYCVGRRIVGTGNRLPGKVAAILNSKAVMVSWSGHKGFYTAPIGNLALGHGCAGPKHCVGAKVKNTNDFPGVIYAITSKTHVFVKYFENGQDQYYNWPISQLKVIQPAANSPSQKSEDRKVPKAALSDCSDFIQSLFSSVEKSAAQKLCQDKSLRQIECITKHHLQTAHDLQKSQKNCSR